MSETLLALDPWSLLAQLLSFALIFWALSRPWKRPADPTAVGRIDAVDLRRAEDPGLPEELSPLRASLVLTEGRDPRRPAGRARVFHCNAPVPLNGTPDEVYRLRESRLLVPVDTKPAGPRDSVWPSEQIQLSVYKVILERGYGEKVANHGYIRRAYDNGAACFIRTELLTEAEVVDYYLRYEALAENSSYAPRRAPNPGLCQKCAHRQACPHEVA